MYKKLFLEIEALEEKYIKVWQEVCDIESPTEYKEGVDRVGDYFAERALALGFEVERFVHGRAGNVVVITMNKNSEEAPISLSGHMDTVHKLGSFPEGTKIKDGKIYGAGAVDCKGGIVAGLMAMEALKNCGFAERPVMLLLQSDEECNKSQKATIKYICEKAKDSLAFLNLESYNKGDACLMRKGIMNLRFIIEGKEAHSARCATEGASAIHEAAYKIIELEKLKDKDGLTCTCTLINGGTAHNTVAGRVELNANVRYAAADEREYMLSYAKKVADTVYVEGCKTTLVMGGSRVAMEYTDRNADLLKRMNEVFEKCSMPTLRAVASTGGSDAADVTVYGIPCVDNLGVEGEGHHTKDEYAYVSSLSESAKRLAALAVGLK